MLEVRRHLGSFLEKTGRRLNPEKTVTYPAVRDPYPDHAKNFPVGSPEFYQQQALDLKDRIESEGLFELTQLPQWVVWKKIWIPDQDRMGKIPHNPLTKQIADNDDPTTCMGSFDAAIKTMATGEFNGIGYVFMENDPYTGNDFDNCVENGNVVGQAAEAIGVLNSYTEISQSGTGIHILTKNSPLPFGNYEIHRCRPIHTGQCVEMHDKKKYYAISGYHLQGTSNKIETRPEEQTKWSIASLWTR